MKRNSNVFFIVAPVVFAALFAAASMSQERSASEAPTAKDPPRQQPLSVAEARGRAKLLHDTYEATLHIAHREYFHEGERITLPARALEDVFALIDEETKGKTRWISVNAQAMSINHKPKTKFEKQAAKELSSGKDSFEAIEGGVYHRAGSIRLFASCLGCHEPGVLPNQRRANRKAALVISLPVKAD